MIAQVVVRVVDQDAEDNAAVEFATIRLSISALGLRQIDQFEIACARFAIGFV